MTGQTAGRAAAQDKPNAARSARLSGQRRNLAVCGNRAAWDLRKDLAYAPAK